MLNVRISLSGFEASGLVSCRVTAGHARVARVSALPHHEAGLILLCLAALGRQSDHDSIASGVPEAERRRVGARIKVAQVVLVTVDHVVPVPSRGTVLEYDR